MTFREQLYSFLPELQDLDKYIGTTLVQSNIDYIKDQYSSELSNCASLDEMIIKNPNSVFKYLSVLENQIVTGKLQNSISNVASVIQKISILETAYSNLLQSSTQSS